MSISIGGLGNGIDYSAIVNQLVQIEQQQTIDPLTAQKQSIQSKLTDLSLFGGKLTALQSAALALSTAPQFNATAVTTSDSTILNASSTNGATPGSYQVQVTQLATAHQIASKAATAVADPTSSIVANPSATFAFKVGSGTVQTVTLNQGASLNDLVDGINNLNAGVQASVVNGGTDIAPAYRLVLTAASTGAANAIAVQTDTTSLDLTNTGGSGGLDTLQAAQDAILVIGNPSQTPLTLQRSSNIVTDAIPGVTLTLRNLSAANTPITVSVTQDTDSIKTKLKALVSAYNDAVTFATSRMKGGTPGQQPGIFVNESSVRTVLSQIRDALGLPVSGIGDYNALSLIGFKTNQDGTLSIDDDALTQALSTHYTDVRNLLIGQSASTGAAKRVVSTIDDLNDVEYGVLTTRTQSLNTRVSDLQNEIDQKTDRLSDYQTRLQLQYAQLDAALSQMKSLQSTLSSFTSR